MVIIKRNTPSKQYSNYTSYKQLLRIEFNHSCAYCNTKESELGGSKSFHIDHYRPKRHFPDLANVYSNLLYTCRDCNNYKADYWPTFWQKITGLFIINPCEQDPESHIDRSNSFWSEKSKLGLWNLTKLRLNSPTKVRIRDDRLVMQKNILELEKLQLELSSTLENMPNDKIESDIIKRLAEIKELIVQLRRKSEAPLD